MTLVDPVLSGVQGSDVGKHKTTGMKIQVACTIYRQLAWISDPVNGSCHDNYGLSESGVLLTLNPKDWIGDKGYVGNDMIMPSRNRLAASYSTGRKSSIPRSTRSAG